MVLRVLVALVLTHTIKENRLSLIVTRMRRGLCAVWFALSRRIQLSWLKKTSNANTESAVCCKAGDWERAILKANAIANFLQ